jgi:hypothetical protein
MNQDTDPIIKMYNTGLTKSNSIGSQFWRTWKGDVLGMQMTALPVFLSCSQESFHMHRVTKSELEGGLQI